MDFAALPPEINSGRMYSGPGSASILAAARAWDELTTELHAAAASYDSVIAGLTSGAWLGPSSISMAAAATGYVAWLSATATQAAQAHAQANAAAAAYEAAFAMTVPPPVVAANRALQMSLIATNFLGQNTPAIVATEALYAEMWAQDAAAMFGYAAAAAAATTLTPFTPPPLTTNPGGLARQAGTRAHLVMSKGPRVMAAVPQALERLATFTPPLWVYDLMEFIADMTVFMAVGASIVSACMGVINTVGGLISAASAPATAALGSAAAGIGSAAGAVGSMGLGAGPAISAGLGRAGSIGAMSVPPSWAASALPKGAGMARLTGPRAGGVPAVMEGGPGMPGMPMATGAGRGGDSAPRYGFRLTVMARPVAAG